MDFEDDVEIVELNGDLDNFQKELIGAMKQLQVGATYCLDDGRFITGFEIHPSENRIMFLTD